MLPSCEDSQDEKGRPAVPESETIKHDGSESGGIKRKLSDSFLQFAVREPSLFKGSQNDGINS